MHTALDNEPPEDPVEIWFGQVYDVYKQIYSFCGAFDALTFLEVQRDAAIRAEEYQAAAWVRDLIYRFWFPEPTNESW